MKFILGIKLGMSQIFNEQGKVIPVTAIEAGPCLVTQIKEGAVQVGFIEKKKKNIKKSEKPFKHLKEFKGQGFKQGARIDVSLFEQGDKVKISGVSKGKGFQGGVKRWGFSGRNASHGVKHEERTIGSVGSAFPQRVFKGKKMPGHAGVQRTTIKNLKVVKIDKENNLLFVKGAVPGPRGKLLEIRG